MPIVLVQNPITVNDEYAWKDIEGEQYHFPNQYKNRCKPGIPFVYYRGTRRSNGKRGIPEYFGYGRVGEVWRDSAVPESTALRNWAWYCSISEYVPFANPIPAKVEGVMLETIARNHWSVGIRNLPQHTFDRILQLAGIAVGADQDAIELPGLSVLSIEESLTPLLVPRRPNLAGNVSEYPRARYAKNATLIGSRAEEIVHRFLMENATELGAKNVRWISREGLTPGWDLQYENYAGDVVAIEVKGSAGPIFASIDVTLGEWKAALAMKDRFWLYLVANCCGVKPSIQRIQNPAILLESGVAALAPIVYRFSMIAQEQSDPA